MYGGPEEIRTLDLSDANRTLSQLSYRPKYCKFKAAFCPRNVCYYNTLQGQMQAKNLGSKPRMVDLDVDCLDDLRDQNIRQDDCCQPAEIYGRKSAEAYRSTKTGER
jgi:hypothetical protein